MIPIARPVIQDEEINNVVEVLKSGCLAQGRWVKKFEEDFANYIGVDYAVATVNGTAALDLALKALNIGLGDEVIVSDFSFISTANSILFQNAKPVFADIEEKFFTVNPEDVLDKITRKTKAVICVHLFGQPCDLKALKEICEDHNLFLIEDCAQAHGALYNSMKVGSTGIGCFSFYATKNMTTGEGGMVTTNDRSIMERLRLLVNHGQLEKYVHGVLGYNLRMTDIQGALGVAQLKKLDSLNSKRIKNAEYYNKYIVNPKLIKPVTRANTVHVYHQYVLRVKDRENFINYLNSKDVGTAIHYPSPIHLQPLYQKLNYPPGICPVSTRVSKEVVSIPVHPHLSEDELKYIVETVNKW
ncbi:MAG: DegT/DnrJ/EryC1/StrS family aminotransferase [Candidatus Odinarchaeum yellowstonii]|uniref:DegT/DnrJ/EryC1/StrS family aminotransferase n=1 Tax=Odinarchaeota yellowstonii (strain LCB_4) TaxID=1841599 RepID=A0AAF0D1D6_ODILC|nr:MAG: DegT/DnrJ/EryC1/StrS family aminotransferase [Candidatus Odinarchaeum yellowstonii]